MRSAVTRFLVLAVALLSTSVTAGAGQEREAGPGQEGDTVDGVEITPIHHGSLMLEHQGMVIHVDPWGEGDYRELPAADILLITDVHSDHLDVELASRLMTTDTTVIGSPSVGDRWGGVDTILENGESTVVDTVHIEAVPMYNLERGPVEGQVYHEKGRGNGYVLTFGDTRVYVSGDTECTPEMRQLRDIDVAFVSMNLPYTMTPGEAAECVAAFAPRIVYPYHYRGSDLEVFTWSLRDTEVEVRLRDWYPR